MRLDAMSFSLAYNHNADIVSVNKGLPDENRIMVVFGDTIESGVIMRDGTAKGFSHYTVTYQDGTFSISGKMSWYTIISVMFSW